MRLVDTRQKLPEIARDNTLKILFVNNYFLYFYGIPLQVVVQVDQHHSHILLGPFTEKVFEVFNAGIKGQGFLRLAAAASQQRVPLHE